MDPIAHNRRLGLKIGDDIPDKVLVERKRNKEPESARLILQLACHRVSSHMSEDERGDSVLLFLKNLAYDTKPVSELEAEITTEFLTKDAPDFIDRHRSKIGKEFADDLKASFKAAVENDFLTNWLTISFGLASERYRKDTKGLTANEERNFEIADSVERIRKQLKGGKLKQQIESYLLGDKQSLPVCLEREIRLWGYPTTSGYDPATREALSDTISTEYRPAARRQLADEIAKITEHDERSSTTAAQVYVECVKACVRLIEKIIADERSCPDRTRLAQRKATLSQYGATSRGKGNRGVSVRGIQNVWKKYNKHLPHWTSRRNDTADTNADRKATKALAREDPTVHEAIRIINSPDVGNHSRPTLLKLQKQTPQWAQPIWPDLWNEFQSALARVSSSMRED